VLLVACGVAGAASLGGLFAQQQRESAADSDSLGSREPVMSPVGVPPALGSGSQPVLLTSGRNYTRDTLQQLPAPSPEQNKNFDAASFSAGPLAGLSTSAGFTDCIAAVRVDHPGEVRTADFARYEGSPALILQVVQGTTTVVVAVSGECGRAGDAHELASAVLG
jgi:hypothetical protein